MKLVTMKLANSTKAIVLRRLLRRQLRSPSNVPQVVHRTGLETVFAMQLVTSKLANSTKAIAKPRRKLRNPSDVPQVVHQLGQETVFAMYLVTLKRANGTKAIAELRQNRSPRNVPRDAFQVG
jgi:hypothetical protein